MSPESFGISDIAMQQRSIYFGSPKMQLMNWPFLKLAKITSQGLIYFFLKKNRDKGLFLVKIF